MCLCWASEKNIYTAQFPDALWKQISVYFCVSPYEHFCFKGGRWSKILSGIMEVGERLNNFLTAVRCLGLVKCFTIFHFNWNLSKFNCFSVFQYFHQYHWNAKIFQTIWTSRVRLWLNFSWEVTFCQYKIIWQ